MDRGEAIGAEDVLAFWFGELDANGCADERHSARWFEKNPAFDRAIAERFGALHAAVAAGEREDLRDSPRGLLAYVIVLDQLSRNMFRSTPVMFAHDARALAAAREAVDRGDDAELAPDERAFLYMPFMHAEDVESQRRCCALFEALRDAAQPGVRARFAYNLDFAERHRAIVERFGRFPHRNALLGRASTPEELEFLKEEGSSF